MRKLVTFLCLLALTAATAAAAFAATGTAARAHKTVALKDDRFSPRKLTIKKGTKVTFAWRGQNQHDVRGGGLHSRLKRHGSYSHIFRKKGTYHVFCSIHVALGMRMTIKVS